MVVEARAAMAAAAARADRVLPRAVTGVLVHDDESWHGRTHLDSSQ